MKITKQQLNKIIKEELQSVLESPCSQYGLYDDRHGISPMYIILKNGEPIAPRGDESGARQSDFFKAWRFARNLDNPSEYTINYYQRRGRSVQNLEKWISANTAYDGQPKKKRPYWPGTQEVEWESPYEE